MFFEKYVSNIYGLRVVIWIILSFLAQITIAFHIRRVEPRKYVYIQLGKVFY